MITDAQKEAIRVAAQAYVGRYASQNKAANSLKGISNGTLSTILNRKWENISEAMWLKLQAQVCGAQGWHLCETVAYRSLIAYMQDAQEDANVIWVTGPAGIGKSTAAREYAKTHRDVFVLTCSEDMTRADFIRELATVIGVNAQGLKVRETLQEIIRELLTKDAPLLIFDEGDKLTDSVLYYYVSLYNSLEELCGMVFLSTDYIQKRISRGVQSCKKGYDEIDSRICRRFVGLQPVNSNEVAAICRANGLEDEVAIEVVKQEAASCRNDLRRVKKSIHKELKKLALSNR